MILQNKVVILTGASEGIGRAIAERLVGEGAKLALVARTQGKLEAVAKAVGGEAFVCDVRNPARMKEVVEAIVAKFGGIDVLINNAGIWQKTDQLDQLADGVIDDVLATNLAGTIHMTKYALPYLRKDDETAIIQIVSKSGISAQEGQSVYTASKYGVKGFTDVLRVDLKDTKIDAPLKSNQATCPSFQDKLDLSPMKFEMHQMK